MSAPSAAELNELFTAQVNHLSTQMTQIRDLAYKEGFAAGRQAAEREGALGRKRAADVAQEWLRAPRAPGESVTEFMSNDRPQRADGMPAVTPKATAILGPEHTLVTPLSRPIGRDHSRPLKATQPRTLADADSLADELSEIVQAIQEIADGGKMPSINVYNREKPPHLPVWQVIAVRHEIDRWGNLAEMCGLEYKPKAGMTDARRQQLEDLKAARAAGGRGRHGVDNEAGRHTKRGSYIPTERELIAELQRQAMGGVMPSIALFNDLRPANWATADAHMKRMEMTWGDLAEIAGLRLRPGGRRGEDRLVAA